MILDWLMPPLALFACWRWWHWKREAYATRGAAAEQFRLIRESLTPKEDQ